MPSACVAAHEPRAVWMYLTKSTGDDERDRNATKQDELFAWFSSRKVAELHLDVGGFLSSSADRALLTDGLRQTSALGVHNIDIQFQACDAIDGCLAQATTLLQYSAYRR